MIAMARSKKKPLMVTIINDLLTTFYNLKEKMIMVSRSEQKLSAFSTFHTEVQPDASPERLAVTQAYRIDEPNAVAYLLSELKTTPTWQKETHQKASVLVQGMRQKKSYTSGIDALMHEFSLSSDEGVALMCLAEALLRIPDRQTADQLIADKIGKGEWKKHLGGSSSVFVNMATWGLLVTGKLVRQPHQRGMAALLTRILGKGGEPLIRKGMDVAMRMLGNRFVKGRHMAEALHNSIAYEKKGYRYSYDMLGEAALTEKDAANYCQSYEDALHAIGQVSQGRGIHNGPGISIKLSALHPRYVRSQYQRVMRELLPRVKQLVLLAKHYDVGINIDAEEADRLELSLDIMTSLVADKELSGFDGLGFVVQAYQKRCPFVIDYLSSIARKYHKKIMIRLVKGAYWDTEIKRTQVEGLVDYPVYTRKAHTDLSYIVCAQKLLAAADVIYPQFATHNAQTLAAVWLWAKHTGVTQYEFQCLHGMGETLYAQLVGHADFVQTCRIYAPVGSHQILLPYLVRRLLENGANSSFINQVAESSLEIETLLADPIALAQEKAGAVNMHIPLPRKLYGAERVNSAGIDLSNEETLRWLDQQFALFGQYQWAAAPLLATVSRSQQKRNILNPAKSSDLVGVVVHAEKEDVDQAFHNAEKGATVWRHVSAAVRATLLFKAADLFEYHMPELMALAVREAGKSLPNAIAEVREAVDFLRYYATQIRHVDGTDDNSLGTVVCISPWNFPLAIFVGEVSAALAAGNVVLAKPAEQTSLMAHRAVQLLHEAGIPINVLQLLPGDGDTIGAMLVGDHRVKGVIFTGSTEVAHRIQRGLIAHIAAGQEDIPLIAETGGQNAMIVDSSALPEQVVQDVLLSAFDSAGQRCSALRVLCLQEDIADKVTEMLWGAMQELRIGAPDSLATDIGPVIDEEALTRLQTHIDHMREHGHQIRQLTLPEGLAGNFMPPTLIDIKGLHQLHHEVFGPVLHILRYPKSQFTELVDAINASGYGLTLGIHTRIDQTIDYVSKHAHVGNVYANRNMVGAVVGVQPFGGEGKSGTGPKAGGPLYLARLQHGAMPSLPATAPLLQNAILTVLLEWASKTGHQILRQLSEYYQQHSLLYKTLSLPGPTGETNTLSFYPKGKIACVASNKTVFFNQLVAVLATGNIPVVQINMVSHIVASLPGKVRALIQETDCAQIADLKMVLVESDLAAQWVPLMAAREGAIIPVIPTTADQPVPLWRLVAERALSVNTTAAGGNASLMTLKSS